MNLTKEHLYRIYSGSEKMSLWDYEEILQNQKLCELVKEKIKEYNRKLDSEYTGSDFQEDLQQILQESKK